jgi:hypothetical protein
MELNEAYEKGNLAANLATHIPFIICAKPMSRDNLVTKQFHCLRLFRATKKSKNRRMAAFELVEFLIR